MRYSVGVAVVDELTARAMLMPDVAYARLSPSVAFGLHCMWLEDRPPPKVHHRFIEELAAPLREPAA